MDETNYSDDVGSLQNKHHHAPDGTVFLRTIDGPHSQTFSKTPPIMADAWIDLIQRHSNQSGSAVPTLFEATKNFLQILGEKRNPQNKLIKALNENISEDAEYGALARELSEAVGKMRKRILPDAISENMQSGTDGPNQLWDTLKKISEMVEPESSKDKLVEAIQQAAIEAKLWRALDAAKIKSQRHTASANGNGFHK